MKAEDLDKLQEVLDTGRDLFADIKEVEGDIALVEKADEIRLNIADPLRLSISLPGDENPSPLTWVYKVPNLGEHIRGEVVRLLRDYLTGKRQELAALSVNDSKPATVKGAKVPTKKR